MNKNESKYFNTAIRMDEALLTLLERKDFAYITIREICAAAGVNRSTFYLHYENTSDLLKETVQYIIDKHLKYYAVDTEVMSQRYENRERSELIFVTTEYLTPYLTFIKENQRLFRIFMKQFDALHLSDVYGRMFDHIFNPILARFGVPQKERGYIMKFYLSGICAVIMEWLNRECSDEMSEIVKIITECVLGERSVHGKDA